MAEHKHFSIVRQLLMYDYDYTTQEFYDNKTKKIINDTIACVEKAQEQSQRVLKVLEGRALIVKQKANFGTLVCPSCAGSLRYTRAQNGHIRAKCDTDNCISFIE